MVAQRSPFLVCVIGAVIVGAVVEAVTPIFVETGMAMVAPTAVDTLAPTEGMDARVNCGCEEDCNDCDDIEASILANFTLEKVS